MNSRLIIQGLALILVGVFSFSASAQDRKRGDKNKMTYFSCVVNEPAAGHKTRKITVKFAVKGLAPLAEESDISLVTYPGLTDEDSGAIMVLPKPKENDERYPIMMNLNAQGGDLRYEQGNIRLWGDGDGYEFTDLVIWDASDDKDVLEGYVRDYGSTYGDTETFKQFIKCKKSDKVL